MNENQNLLLKALNFFEYFSFNYLKGGIDRVSTRSPPNSSVKLYFLVGTPLYDVACFDLIETSHRNIKGIGGC